MKPPSKLVPIKTKGLKRKLLTEAEQSLESERFREQKIVSEAIRFHTKLGAQLFHSNRTPSLISFDTAARLAEAVGSISNATLNELEQMRDDINETLKDTNILLTDIRANTGPLEIMSNESNAPLICPTKPLRNRAAFSLQSDIAQALNLLDLLISYDTTVRNALALRQFGFLSQQVWQNTIVKATRNIRTLFMHTL